MQIGKHLRPSSLGFLAAAVILLIAGTVNLGHYLRLAETPQNGQDFAAYYVAARMLREGNYHIYAAPEFEEAGRQFGVYPNEAWQQPYLYPPLLAQALAPLAALPFHTARVLWLALSCFLLLAALVVATVASPPAHRRWIVLLWVTLPHHVTSLYMGQADTLVTAVLAAGAVSLKRRGWTWAEGSVALAAAVKLTPVLATAGLLGPGRNVARLAAAGCILPAGSFLLTLAQGAPFLWLTYAAALPGAAGVTRDWVENVSLSAMLRRLFLDATHPLPGLLEAAPFLTIANLIAAAQVLVAGILLAAVFRAPNVRHYPTESGVVGEHRYVLAVVWLLLVSPITWPSTLSLLVIPAVYLVGELHTALSSQRVLAASVILGVLWTPDTLLTFLSLEEISFLRTGALLALFLLLAVSPGRMQMALMDSENNATGLLRLAPRRRPTGPARRDIAG